MTSGISHLDTRCRQNSPRQATEHNRTEQVPAESQLVESLLLIPAAAFSKSASSLICCLVLSIHCYLRLHHPIPMCEAASRHDPDRTWNKVLQSGPLASVLQRLEGNDASREAGQHVDRGYLKTRHAHLAELQIPSNVHAAVAIPTVPISFSEAGWWPNLAGNYGLSAFPPHLHRRIQRASHQSVVFHCLLLARKPVSAKVPSPRDTWDLVCPSKSTRVPTLNRKFL